MREEFLRPITILERTLFLMGDRFCRPVYPMLYLGPEITFLYVAKSLIYLAPRAGFEPATNRLTAVLPNNTNKRAWLRYLGAPAAAGER